MPKNITDIPEVKKALENYFFRTEAGIRELRRLHIMPDQNPALIVTRLRKDPMHRKHNSSILNARVDYILEYDRAEGREPRKKSIDSLSNKIWSVPSLVYANENKIFMFDAGGLTFSQIFDSLDEDSKKLLHELKIAEEQSKSVTQRELESRHNGIKNVIVSLIRRGFIRFQEPGVSDVITTSLDHFGENIDYFKVRRSWFKSSLVEGRNFQKLRFGYTEKTLERLLEIQKVGNSLREDFEAKGITTKSFDSLVERDFNYAKSIIQHKLQESGRKLEDIAASDIESIKEEIARLVYLTKDCDPARTEFIQGDAYPENILIRHNDVRVVDFFHAKFGNWLTDVVDFLTYISLFCNIPENKERGYYEKFLMLKQSQSKSLGLNDDYETRLKAELPIMKARRALRASGVLSRPISSKENGEKPLSYSHRRGPYLDYLRQTLKETPETSLLYALIRKYVE
ncbi:hypothetical protein HYX18_01050 [Candidatus Woesearchaeota archaeon]|nr:hypothetical protein [Candidatus Woesearchaeota archaeon]